jgi:hypothetical protein
MKERVENNFCVTAGFEAKAGLFQLRTEVAVVEYLAVENQRYIAIWTAERLIAGIKINYAKPSGTERNLWRFEFPEAVRTPMVY